jgi:hypothetical protein
MTSKQSSLASRSWALAVGAALVIGCEVTGPRSPLEGDYDVTTVLDTFSFETAAPSPPDCPAFTLYCTHVRAFSGATLSGVLHITDDGRGSDSLKGSGTFSGFMCASVDYAGLTGCTSVKSRTDYYASSHSTVAPGSLSLELEAGELSDYKPLLSFLGNFAGDSIAGRVYWRAAAGRSPPTHWGRFIARRRR